MAKALSRTEMLKRLLGSVRAVGFRPEHAAAYVEKRLAEKKCRPQKRQAEAKERAGAIAPPLARNSGVSEATIARELEVLNAAFGYAVKRGTLRFRPYIERPTVDNVSEREFPLERLDDLLAALRRRDEPLADMVEFISRTARRPEGLRRLTWALFDAKAWTLTIPPEKKGNAVLIGLDGALRAIIERRLAARRLGCEFIFHRKGRKLWEDYDRKVFSGGARGARASLRPRGRADALQREVHCGRADA